MFKGLKSKLGDEAKRLQAMGETLAQQVRTTASDAGSDISAQTRRFFQPEAPESSANASDADAPKKPVADLNNELIISLDDENDVADQTTSSSAIMQEVSGEDLLNLGSTPRQRRASSGSVDSTDSSLSTFFGNPVIPFFEPMETIASDVERTWNDSDSVSANSSSLASASKEQISSVLSKLHGRAANYKDRYRELVKLYNEVVKENKKCRTVLTTTQDKALAKIEALRDEKKQLNEKLKAEMARSKDPSEDAAKVKRLQELLEKCKESISHNKEKIAQLSSEKERLQKNLNGANDDNEMTQLAIERVTAEWKGRVDRVEEEYQKKLAECEEKAAITIATSKAEMHAALQHKDNDIETWMMKCQKLEQADADANGRWQSKVNSLTAAIAALETEKADMVEKLSQAKQEGAVREEEMKRRIKLEEKYEMLRKADASASAEKLETEIRKVEEEWRQKLKDQEEQMQLAIEEREMVKVAALTEHDRKLDELEVINAQLNEEKIKLQAQFEEIREKHRRQMQELSTSIETNSARHKEEIARLNESHQEVLGSMKMAIDVKQAELDEVLSKETNVTELEKTIATLQAQLKELTENSKVQLESLEQATAENIEMKKEIENVHRELEEQHQKVREADALAAAEKLESEIRKAEEQWLQQKEQMQSTIEEREQKLKDKEEQMQLAIVEREKVASASEQEHVSGELEVKYAQLNEEKNKLQAQLEEIREKDGRQVQELNTSIATNSARHKEKIARLNEKHEEVLSSMKQAIDSKQAELDELLFKERNVTEMEKTISSLQAQLKETVESNKANLESLEQTWLARNSEMRKEIENVRRELEEKHQTMREADAVAAAEKLESEIRKAEEEWRQKLKDQEEQMQLALVERQQLLKDQEEQMRLAIEEREKVKVAALSEQDRKCGEMEVINVQLNEEKIKLQAQLEEIRASIETNSARHNEEIARLNESHQEVQDHMKLVIDAKQAELNELLSKERNVAEMEKTISTLQTQLNESVESSKANLESLEQTWLARNSEMQKEIDNVRQELEEKHQQMREADAVTSAEKLESEIRRVEEEWRQKLKYQEEQMQLALAERDKVKVAALFEQERKGGEMEVINAQLNEEKIKLQAQLDEILEKHGRQMQELSTSVETNSARHKEELTRLTESHEEALGSMKLIIDVKQTELDEHLSKIHALQAQLEESTESSKAHLLSLEQAATENAEMKNEIENARRELEEQHQKVREADALAAAEKLEGEIRKAEEEWRQQKEQMQSAIEEREKDLQTKLQEAEEQKRAEIKKAQTKADSDRQRMVRDLQKEIKQLYQDLNDKTAALDSANSRIYELEEITVEKLNDKGLANAPKHMSIDDEPSVEAVDQEELQNLRDRICQYQKEVAELREMRDGRKSPYSGATTAAVVDVHNMNRHVPTVSVPVHHAANHYDSNLSFAEPTEAEYLRNVLYRYMNERETLGKEIVTLAKVIGTVSKFSKEQLESVVRKEEVRSQGWGAEMSTDEANTSESSPLDPPVALPQPSSQPQYQEVELEVENRSSAAADRTMAEVALSFSNISRFVEISDPLDPSSFISSRNPSRPRRVQVHLAVSQPMPGSFMADIEGEERQASEGEDVEMREATPESSAVVEESSPMNAEEPAPMNAGNTLTPAAAIAALVADAARNGGDGREQPQADRSREEGNRRTLPNEAQHEDDEDEDEEEEEQAQESRLPGPGRNHRDAGPLSRRFHGLPGAVRHNDVRVPETMGFSTAGPFGATGFSSMPSSSNIANRHRKDNTLLPDPSTLSFDEQKELYEEQAEVYDATAAALEDMKKDRNVFEVGDEQNKITLYTVRDEVVKEKLKEWAEWDVECDELLPLSWDQVKEGTYEGGFRLGEEWRDLANFMLNKENNIVFDSKEICEIGCGAGLLGAICCHKGCSRLTLQDFNKPVLDYFTKMNFYISNLKGHNVEYVYGDWLQLERTMGRRQYDLIFTAGTTYNPKNYHRLHVLMLKILKDDGAIYLAAKTHYPEHSGNISGFLDYVRKEKSFQVVEKLEKPSTSPDMSVKIVELRKLPAQKLTTSFKNGSLKKARPVRGGVAKTSKKDKNSPAESKKASKSK